MIAQRPERIAYFILNTWTTRVWSFLSTAKVMFFSSRMRGNRGNYFLLKVKKDAARECSGSGRGDTHPWYIRSSMIIVHHNKPATLSIDTHYYRLQHILIPWAMDKWNHAIGDVGKSSVVTRTLTSCCPVARAQHLGQNGRFAQHPPRDWLRPA